jgi:hypothetical protein
MPRICGGSTSGTSVDRDAAAAPAAAEGRPRSQRQPAPSDSAAVLQTGGADPFGLSGTMANLGQDIQMTDSEAPHGENDELRNPAAAHASHTPTSTHHSHSSRSHSSSSDHSRRAQASSSADSRSASNENPAVGEESGDDDSAAGDDDDDSAAGDGDDDSAAGDDDDERSDGDDDAGPDASVPAAQRVFTAREIVQQLHAELKKQCKAKKSKVPLLEADTIQAVVHAHRNHKQAHLNWLLAFTRAKAELAAWLALHKKRSTPKMATRRLGATLACFGMDPPHDHSRFYSVFTSFSLCGVGGDDGDVEITELESVKIFEELLKLSRGHLKDYILGAHCLPALQALGTYLNWIKQNTDWLDSEDTWRTFLRELLEAQLAGAAVGAYLDRKAKTVDNQVPAPVAEIKQKRKPRSAVEIKQEAKEEEKQEEQQSAEAEAKNREDAKSVFTITIAIASARACSVDRSFAHFRCL